MSKLERKRFSGYMNLDDKEADLLPHQHKYAKNVRFYGSEKGLTVENVKGNVVIPNSFLPESGSNECIGAFFDAVKGRIIWANWNSGGRHGWYQYRFATGEISKIFLCFSDTADDIFEWDLDYPIHSIALIYRTESDGDLLYWTNGLGKPMYLNIDTVSTVAPFTVDMVTAAKLPPLSPCDKADPTTYLLAYANDSTVTVNLLSKKLFRFAYRWGYKNLEKSTLSPISSVPLPQSIYDEADPTKNCKIKIPLKAGGEDYQTIELFGQVNIDNNWSDFFLIATLDRDADGIAPSASYEYQFYNDGMYPTDGSVYINNNPANGLHYFDYVPNVANTLEALNGNVIIYGGITDGYDRMDPADYDVAITSSIVYGGVQSAAAWDWSRKQQFAIVYFDSYGKPVDIISAPMFAVNTPDFNVSGSTVGRPQISAAISHIPPANAVSYQWLRAATTPAPLTWLTNDFQQDSQYLYLCIENLDYLKEKNSGFVPSYEFKAGDRVKIMAFGTPATSLTPYNVQYDFEILGEEERMMGTPIQKGRFIKVKKPTTPTSTPYVNNMLIKIYTPIGRVNEKQQVYYEWGQKYDIYESGGVRYHRGQINTQTAIQPATFTWQDGDMYFRARNFYLNVNDTNTQVLAVMDANFSDYFPSAVNSNGRGWVIDSDAKEEYNPVISRWGGAYQSGTNINALNRFFPADFDEADRSKGDIRRFATIDRRLVVLQARGVGQYGIYSRFIQNNQGQSELISTNDIITANNIQYYLGDYGLGNQSCGMVKANGRIYFDDPVRGYQLRLSGDGITPISSLYDGQFYIRDLLTPYASRTYLRNNGFKSKILKFYDYFNEEAVSILQGGDTDINPLTVGYDQAESASTWGFGFSGTLREDDVVVVTIDGHLFTYAAPPSPLLATMIATLVNDINVSPFQLTATVTTNGGLPGFDVSGDGSITASISITHSRLTIGSYTFSFNETRNAYSSFFSYSPEWATCANDIIFTWKNGNLYIHNSDTYCNFYGTQYDAEIQVVFNENLNDKKTWLAIEGIANSVWACPQIYSNVMSYGTQRQQTSLVAAEFATLEGNFHAAIKRDANSRGGKINGSTMKGNWLCVTLKKSGASSLIYLNEVLIKTIDSPLNR